jgi:hypothetical protein
VALLNPDELFSQADLLLSHPNEVDFRRAISAAYYGLFHAVLTAAADQALGFQFRWHRIYSYVYRSVSHTSLREVCEAINKSALPAKFRPFAPEGGFDNHLRQFAAVVVELQEKRYIADYDPVATVPKSDAETVIRMARAALTRFYTADPEHKVIFLTLLLFRSRAS